MSDSIAEKVRGSMDFRKKKPNAPTRAESNVIKSTGAAVKRARKRLHENGLRANPRARKLTPEVKTQIAALVAQGKGLAKVCKAFNVTTVSVYSELKKDPGWQMMMDEARMASKETLEEALFDRAVDRDTTAGIFMLKAMDPDRYGDKVRIDAHHRFEINVSLIPAEEGEDATGADPGVLDAEYEVDEA
jgi:transposase-like protein